jgi:hypothetical protein
MISSKNIAKKVSMFLLAIVTGILIYALSSLQEPVAFIEGNSAMKPLNFTLNRTNDIVCKMLIRSYENSAQVVDESGVSHFFNDIGCMINWLEQQSRGKRVILWVYTSDSHRWIDAHIAWYSVRETTPLGYGFSAKEKHYKGTIDFDEMQRRMRHGETLLNPKTRKMLLQNNYP